MIIKFSIFGFLMLLTSLSAAETVSTEQAAATYRQNCAVCHGDKGDGQTRARFGLFPQPRDFTSAQAAVELTRERMIRSVTEGRPNTAMVGWQERLSAAEISGVVDFVRNSFMQQSPSKEALAAVDPYRQRGKQLYEEFCRVCHGDRGNGSSWTNSVLSPPPRNFTSPQARRVLTRERMLHSVSQGRPGTAMMSFAKSMSAQEIETVVDYVRQTFMIGPVIADSGIADVTGNNAPIHDGTNKTTPAIGAHGMRPSAPAAIEVKTDMNESFPGGLIGDFEQGRDFYLRNCSACHGARGDGLGPRSRFIVPKPRNFLHPESRKTLNRPALFKAIVIGKAGTVMPAWGKVLGPQQVANVAEFVFQDFINPDAEKIAVDKKKAN